MADYAPPDRPSLDQWLDNAPPPPPPPVSYADKLAPYLGDRLTGAHGTERYQLWPERAVRGIAEAVHSGVTAPRDALTGKLQVNDPETGMPTSEAVQRAGDLSSILMGGGMPAAEKNALGIGGGRIAYKAPGEAGASPERITGAAIKMNDGQVFTGVHHVEAMDNARKTLGKGWDIDNVAAGDEGMGLFTTSSGRLVDRKEAGKIAEASSQAEPTEWLRAHDLKEPIKEAPPVPATTEPPAAPATAEHPDWINTRLVTSKKAETTSTPQVVGLDAMKQSPPGKPGEMSAYEHNVGLTKEYPNMPANMANASTDQAAEHFIEHNKNNLLWLHDQVPADIRGRSSMWYEGGRKIIDDWSKEYGLKDSHIAGALAALSPQKDWYQNVSLAKRVIETNLQKRDIPMTPQMEKTFTSRPSLNKPEYQPLMDTIRGKSLDDINKINLPNDEKAVLKALWTRLYDESHNSKAFPIVTPEGGFKGNVKTSKGEDAGVGWGSLTEVSKAIRSIEGDGSKETQSALMGNKHKVRNFYNNLLAPNSKRGDVTIDTHAVAAGQLRPLSGTSPEVAHNFSNSLDRKHQPPGWRGAKGSAVNGVHGTYPLYAEAYRRAAKERGILPRQMQSITWEAVRGLFPENMKNKKFSGMMDDIWNDYRNGKVSLHETRSRILKAAGGIRLPTWAGPAS